MKVVYLGTGAAEGIPALFCNCPFCTEARRRGGKMIRSRAQTLYDGELSIDFPPDAFYHAAYLRADLSAVKYLLVTHSHMDHFNPCDLILRGYKYAKRMTSPTLDLYGNAEIAEIYREATRRELKKEVGEHIRVHTLSPFESFSFGAWRAQAVPARHTSREPLLYSVTKDGVRALHLCDTGTLPAPSLEFFAQDRTVARLVTLDCTFLDGITEPTARHMGLDEDLRVKDALFSAGLADEKTKFVLTHFSHNGAPSDETLARAEKLGLIAAYDGMELEI